MSTSTYSFFAGDCCGEIAPSGQSIEDFFGCQDVAAAEYFCRLFSGRGQTCWVHDDEIDGDCRPADWEMTEADEARLKLMLAIEWHETVEGFYANVAGRRLDVHCGRVVSARYGTEGLIVVRDRFEAMARLAAVAYPMAEVPA